MIKSTKHNKESKQETDKPQQIHVPICQILLGFGYSHVNRVLKQTSWFVLNVLCKGGSHNNDRF